jgi:hypothetical protein
MKSLIVRTNWLLQTLLFLIASSFCSQSLHADVESIEERFVRVMNESLKQQSNVLAIVHHYPAASPYIDGSALSAFRKEADAIGYNGTNPVLDLLASNALTFVETEDKLVTNGNSVADSLVLVNADILFTTGHEHDVFARDFVTSAADSMIVGQGTWLVFLEPAEFTFTGVPELTSAIKSLRKKKILSRTNWYKIIDSGAFRMSSIPPEPEVAEKSRADYESMKEAIGAASALQPLADELLISAALEKDIEVILATIVAPLRLGENPNWGDIEKSLETDPGRLLFDRLREDHTGTPLEISANEKIVQAILKRIDRISRVLTKIFERESGRAGIFGISRDQLYRRLKKNRLKLRAQLREVQSRIHGDIALQARLRKKQIKTMRIVRKTGKAKKQRMLRKKRVAERRLGSLANLVRNSLDLIE